MLLYIFYGICAGWIALYVIGVYLDHRRDKQ